MVEEVADVELVEVVLGAAELVDDAAAEELIEVVLEITELEDTGQFPSNHSKRPIALFPPQ